MQKRKASATLAGGGSQGLVRSSCYFTPAAAGLKASANAFPFGVPIPVTLSQPTLVCKADGLLHEVPSKSVLGRAEQSIPKETTSAVSSIKG